MRLPLDPFQPLQIALAGWMNQYERDVIDYLQEENHVVRQQVENKRLRLNDDQRRRLAVKAKKLGWRVLQELTRIVTPETLLAWHQKLIARKYDGSDMIIHWLRMGLHVVDSTNTCYEEVAHAVRPRQLNS